MVHTPGTVRRSGSLSFFENSSRAIDIDSLVVILRFKIDESFSFVHARLLDAI